MTLVLDPGHGGSDPGCCANGLVEKELTLALAAAIKRQLQALGYDVALTRTTDERVPLSERGRRSEELRATQVIALHFDANSDALAGRMMMYRRANDAQSAALGAAIARHAPPWLGPVTTVSVEDTGWKRRAYNVVHAHSASPTLLVECAFLTNLAHATCLRTPRAMSALTVALVAGVICAEVPLTSANVPFVQSFASTEKNS